MLDAGVFPWMERESEERRFVTKADVKYDVHAVWSTLTAETLGRVADRVRRNMRIIQGLDGGN
jgi:hypothetical protein